MTSWYQAVVQRFQRPQEDSLARGSGVYGFWLQGQLQTTPITQDLVDRCIESMEPDSHYPNFNQHKQAPPKLRLVHSC
jgi:hypothetical protein